MGGIAVEDITTTEEWAALVKHRGEIEHRHLRELFAADPARGTELTVRAGDLYLDYAKHRVTRRTLDLLVALAERAGLPVAIDAMYAGEHVNTSEDRPALHIALRLPRAARLEVDGHDVVAEVHQALDRMGALTDRIHAGELPGATGRPIRNVVNIGIGGSDLGPLMAYVALADYHHPGVRCRFVSNLDPTDLQDAVAGLDPAETLFVVSSKTFTTIETLRNAESARRWLAAALGTGPEVAARHFAGVSASTDRVRRFGIQPELTFPTFEWVGGRYSFDSAIGLALMAGIGRESFADLLAGLHTMDEHFRTAPFTANMPVLQGLLGIWCANFLGAQTHAVLPYSSRLRRFPAYLQQLTMESTGKRVRRDGSPVTTTTGEIYWGEPGTNGQHAFYQLLHQGTWPVPADFIGFAEPSGGPGADGGDYDLFLANLLAQAAVLAFGRTAEEVAAEGSDPTVVPHRVMPGNQPTSTILAPRLTPATLGQLVALYEHTVFVKGVVWGVNCFDQWGVELGKAVATQIAPLLAPGGHKIPPLDSSTNELVRWYRAARGRP
ncbi:MAG TPA: glucose-6-phosphate isomerase [Micromonosporaceae bacterium]|nr:glucose-6-phosphate isomerase [Micromonosporaceae bacterium]